MKQLALTLPGSQTINPPSDFRSDFTDLGSVISVALNVAFLVAAVLLFVWMIWGIFQYIYAGGDKESLNKARSRITLALVGFFITLLALIISQFARTIVPKQAPPVTNVTVPGGP